MVKKIKKLYEQFKSLPYQEIQTYAGSSSFFLLLAAIPTIMLLLALSQHLPLVKVDIATYIRSASPTSVKPLVDGILNDIYENGSTALLSASAFTAIYTATRGVFSLMKGMNVMYGVRDDRKPVLKWIIAGIYTVLTVVLILTTAIVLVLAVTLRDFISRIFPHITALLDFIINIRMTTMLCIMIFFFLLIYIFLPNRKTSLIKQLPGAIFSALGWVIASAAFSFYLENYARYSQIYGSLTTIIISMIWIYMLMCILFFGALVNILWENIVTLFKKN